MNFDPAEGIHYIFDRYSFLNNAMEDGSHEERIDQTSSPEMLKRVIKNARAMYHPDRQSRAGEKMRLQAEHMSLLVDDCVKFLLDAELKPLYDEKLNDFLKNHPNVVSKNGNPIIDLNKTFFDISALLSDEVRDTSEFEARVKTMLAYDEKKVPWIKELLDTMPGNAQLKSLYRDALTRKLVYLTLLEEAAWSKLGYLSRKGEQEPLLLNSTDYAAVVEESLKESADRDINASLDQHGELLKLGMSHLPLALPAPESSEIADPAQLHDAIDTIKARARENFDIRAKYVRDVARQKQTVLEELVTLTSIERLHPAINGKKTVDFYLFDPEKDGEQRALLRMELDTAKGNASLAEVYQGENITLSSLKASGFTRESFAITRNPEITDMMLEIATACERFLQPAEEKRTEPKPRPSAPGPKPKM